MKKLLVLCVTALAVAAAAPAPARGAQTFSGGTGLIGVPTAATLVPRRVEVGADFINTLDASLPVRAEIGVVEGLEAGVLFQYNDGGADDRFGANAKYRLPLALPERLRVAVGGSYAVADPADLAELFVVATYGVGFEGVSLASTGGINWLRADDGESDSAIGLLLGFELGLEGVPGLAILFEYDGSNGDVADASAGIAARYAVTDRLAVQGGIKDFGDTQLFVGAQYAFAFAP